MRLRTPLQCRTLHGSDIDFGGFAALKMKVEVYGALGITARLASQHPALPAMKEELVAIRLVALAYRIGQIPLGTTPQNRSGQLLLPNS